MERVNVLACVHTHACMWTQEADWWVCTPNDSALHGQDSCFMSMGAHKLHSLAFLLQQHGANLFAPTLPPSPWSLSQTQSYFFPSPARCCFFLFVFCFFISRCCCCSALNLVKI